MLYSKLEVLVDLGAEPDKRIVEKTLNDLKSRDGVKGVNFTMGAFVVETTLPSTEVVDAVTRSSGKRAVLQGFGETQSAVAMISSQCTPGARVLGVVRFQQSDAGPLVADGRIDGLAPGWHGLHVHETGDLTEGCSSIGGHFNPSNSPHGGPSDPPAQRHAGDLGNIAADEQGRATFRIVDNVLKVWDIIGRSVAVTEHSDDYGKGQSAASKINGNSGQPIACGVIARSAGVFQNPKRICACDGVVVWDERDRPLAGAGRRISKHKSCCQKETEDTIRSCEKEIDDAPRCCQKTKNNSHNNTSMHYCKV